MGGDEVGSAFGILSFFIFGERSRDLRLDLGCKCCSRYPVFVFFHIGEIGRRQRYFSLLKLNHIWICGSECSKMEWDMGKLDVCLLEMD